MCFISHSGESFCVPKSSAENQMHTTKELYRVIMASLSLVAEK